MKTDVESFIDRIAQHLESVVQEETNLLKNNAVADLQDFNLRKSQGLYDLSRAVHRLDGRNFDPATLERLRSLRHTLENNQAALSVHLQAVHEIATVISDAIREAESDGTYAPPFKRAGGSS